MLQKHNSLFFCTRDAVWTSQFPLNRSPSLQGNPWRLLWLIRAVQKTWKIAHQLEMKFGNKKQNELLQCAANL